MYTSEEYKAIGQRMKAIEKMTISQQLERLEQVVKNVLPDACQARRRSIERNIWWSIENSINVITATHAVVREYDLPIDLAKEVVEKVYGYQEFNNQ